MFVDESYRLQRSSAHRSRDTGAEYRIDDHGVPAEQLLRREFAAVGGDVSAVQVENGYVRGQQRKVVPAVGGELVRGRQQDYGNAACVAEAALEQPRHGKPVAAVVPLSGDYKVFGGFRRRLLVFRGLRCRGYLRLKRKRRPFHQLDARDRLMLYRVQVRLANVFSRQYLHGANL